MEMYTGPPFSPLYLESSLGENLRPPGDSGLSTVWNPCNPVAIKGYMRTIRNARLAGVIDVWSVELWTVSAESGDVRHLSYLLDYIFGPGKMPCDQVG